jgi:formate dehydrogenase major subunit
MNDKPRSDTATTPRARPAATPRAKASPASRTPRRRQGRRQGEGAKTITFTLDGEKCTRAGETIWQVAKRHGTDIPHLCYAPEPGYRPDGNCRACMVEIEGERVLAASCIRTPTAGMKVKSASDRARTARRMVFELLVADQPERNTQAHDPASKFWSWADRMGIATSRLPARAKNPEADRSHPAMAVNLDACIQCNLCVRACREVQVNDVIGMAGRGHNEKIVFDFDDPMGASTCVACGECVQACPTGALMPATLVNEDNVRTPEHFPDRKVDSVCPYCGVGCQLTYNIKDDKLLYVTGKGGPANQNRLCVKGRFGFDYVSNPQRLTQPMVRKDGVPKAADDLVDPANPWTHFRPATWEEAMQRAASGLVKIRDRDGPRALAGLWLGQGLERGGLSVPEAGAHRLRLEQCRSLHAALPRLVGRGTARGRRLRGGDRHLQRVQELRRHHRDRRQPDREPPRSRDLLQAGGEARRQADRDGSARAGAASATPGR